jgi:hypothetical protein
MSIQVDVKCTSLEHVPILRHALEGQFWGIRLEEMHGLYLRYSLDRRGHDRLPSVLQVRGVGDLFAMLEMAKGVGHVEEYCVSQTSLEEIFVHFAKQQEEETGHIQGVMSYAAGAPLLQAPPASDIDGGTAPSITLA